jgi:hypothetical protein
VPVRIVVLVVALTALSGLAGCGRDEDRVALAIDRATVTGSVVTVRTECAAIDQVAVRPDPAGSGRPEITVWGRPKVGRCHPSARVTVDGRPDKVVDGATGFVVDLS